MAIVAFMLLPLIMMAVYAKDAIRESSQESMAAAVARQVFSSLSLSTPRSGVLVETDGADRDLDSGKTFSTFKLALLKSGQQIFLVTNTDGRIIEEVPEGVYSQGFRKRTDDDGIVGTIVRISVKAIRVPVFEPGTLALSPGVHYVTVAVEAPATAPAAARNVYLFNSYLGLTDARGAGPPGINATNPVQAID